MAISLDGITASVVDGTLDYEYTDSSSTTTSGTDLGYDEFLQLLCAEMQYQDPLEPTSNTEYIAQLATFSQLEATLSMSDTIETVGEQVASVEESQQNSFANSLVGKEVILLTDSGSYVTGQVDYVTYEDGEVYLCVNDSLYSLSTLDTVADSDYYEAVSISQTFAAMVATLPSTDNLTTEYEGAVTEVRELYDSMTDYQKEFVDEDDLTTLETIEAYLAELLEEEAEEVSQSFTDLVAALPGIDELTTDDEDALTEARELYDGMTDYQKTFVSEDDLTTLESLEEYMEELLAAAEEE